MLDINIWTRIPIIFVVFVLFLVFLNYKIRKNNKEQQKVEDAFWDRERLANSTRKQDISNLPYIIIPMEIIPQKLNTASEKAIVALSKEKILNLTGKTNTDLKMEYGVANLEVLSACDDRFTDLVKHLTTYSQELLDDGQTDAAKKLLEFAVSVEADSKTIYTRLAGLYQESGEGEKIADLMASAEKLNSLSKNSIITALQQMQA